MFFIATIGKTTNHYLENLRDFLMFMCLAFCSTYYYQRTKSNKIIRKYCIVF